MADIINMPAPVSGGGISGSLVAGLGLLAAGAYFVWKKFSGKGSDSGVVSGGSYTDDVIEPENTVSVVTPVLDMSSSVSGNSVSSGSGVSVYRGSGSVDALTFGYDSYVPATKSSVSTMLYGHTEEEQAEIMKQLSAANALRPNSYTIQVTRQGVPVTYTVSGTTGVYGESTNAVVENSVMLGGSGSSGTSNAAAALGAAISSKGSGSSGTSNGAVVPGAVISSKVPSSSSGSGVSTFVEAVKSGGSSGSGSSGNGKTVTTSTGFTVNSIVNGGNSAIKALINKRKKGGN